MSSEKAGAQPAIDFDSLANGVVALLLLLEAVSVLFLWTYASVGSAGETSFALFLAADLVSFAMISYTFRSLKEEKRIGRVALLAGCVFIAALLVAALF